MKKIAVIMAHPDDEILGCGATISRLAREGMSVHILILATGLTSRGPADNTALNTLKQEATQAMSCLGANTIHFADFPDNAMDTRPLLEIIKQVEKFIESADPDIIFTHHNGDINIDHDITQRAVLTATRSLPDTKPVEIFACDVLSSTEFGRSDRRPRPDVYFRLDEKDITATQEALKCYRGEIRSWPHPRSTQALEHKLRLHGAECGSQAAEAFEILRMVR